MRYRLDLSYDGTDFHGWQIQPNGITIQEVIQDKLSQICNQPIEIMGCGRTDTGVHASEYTAHFDYELTLPEAFVYKLNAMLPKSISIKNCVQTHDDFHARFDATLREYQYFIETNPNPFTDRFSYTFIKKLDLDAMNQAVKILIGTNEFQAFCKGLPPADNYRCHVYEAIWFEQGSQIIFKISASRFLRNMVRALVGTSILIGTGKMSVQEFETILKTGTRSDAGNSVAAKGLFLTKVVYPN